MVYAGVHASPMDRRLVVLQNCSSVWLYEACMGEGVAWRSPPNSARVFGRSSVSVLARYCKTYVYALPH